MRRSGALSSCRDSRTLREYGGHLGDAEVTASTTAMFEVEFAIFAAIVFIFALVSRRVERLNVTAPMAFIATGMLFGASHVTSSALNTDVLLLVGSIGLALVLFTDA